MDKGLPLWSDRAQALKFGLYEHYKGILVRVLGVARHSETLEELVMYQHSDDGNFWVRPLTMFLEAVNYEGKRVPRFRIVHE